MIDIVKDKYMEIARRQMIYYEIDGEQGTDSRDYRDQMSSQLYILGDIIKEHASRLKELQAQDSEQ